MSLSAKLLKYSFALIAAVPLFAQTTPQTLGIAYNCQLQCTTASTSAVNNITAGWNTQYLDLAGRGGTGPYKWSLLSGNLPPGLFLSGTTADPTVSALTGYPLTTGSYTFTLKLTDSTPKSARGPETLTAQFTINAQQLALVSQGLVGVVNSNYSDIYLLGASPGGQASDTYAATVSSGNLPPGISLNSFITAGINQGSGILTGSPTTAGTYTFSLQVQDVTISGPLSDPFQFTVVVGPIGLAFNGTTTTLGSAYSDIFGQGGSGTYNWSVVSGSLPAGLTLSPQTPDANGNSNALNGVPTTPGTYSFSIKVQDATDPTAFSTRNITLLVLSPAPLAITPVTVWPVGSFLEQVQATGGTSPYNWTLTGSLPDGITLTAQTPTGGAFALTGTPTFTAAGTYPITLSVSDSTSASAGGPLTATSAFSVVVPGLTVLPDLNQQTFPSEPASGVLAAPGGIVGQPYAGIGGGSTGTAPFKWTVIAGVIPPGLTTNAQTDNTTPNFLVGTPTASGTWSFTVQLTDSTSAAQGGPFTTRQTFVLTIAEAQFYSDPSSGGDPWGLTPGPDGNLWFSESTSRLDPASGEYLYQIGRVSTSGHFLTDSNNNFYALPSIGGNIPEAFQLALANDGQSVWLLEPNQQYLAQITNYGTDPFDLSTVITVPQSSPAVNSVLNPFGITTAGPAGSNSAWVTLALEFGGSGASGILQIASSPDHTNHFYPLTDPTLIPQGITWNASDGAFWFTAAAPDGTVGYIGRMLPDGTMQPPAACSASLTAGVGMCPIAGTIMGGYGGQTYANIVVGPEGRTLWFTDPTTNQIGSITTDGKTVTLYQTPSGDSPTSLVVGPDNALWFAELNQLNSGLVGRLDPATGSIAEFVLSLPSATTTFVPQSIISFDGSLWVTDNGRLVPPGQLVRITPPFSISCTFPDVVVGTAVSGDKCNALGGTSPYTYSVPAGSLPPGLSGPDASGNITGTPTLSGTYNFTVQARDNTGAIATELLALKVTVPALTLTGCDFSAAAIQGVTYSNSNCQAGGGIPPYTFSLASGALPTGLTLNAGTGVVSGSPTIAGSYSFTIQVRDSGDRNTAAQTANSSATLTVALPPLTLTCNTPAGAKVGFAYSGSCTAGNPVGAVTFAISAGSLPPGLSLDAASGAITGTPSAYGTFSFTVRVTDSAPTPRTAVTAITGFTVQPAALTITTSKLPNGASGLPYSGNSFAAGGETPYTWAVVSGGLPPGLALNAATGAVTGTPSQNGSFSFSLQVTDNAAAVSAPQAFTVAISGPVKPAFVEYPLPIPAGASVATGADSIVTGPDGNLWFTTPAQPSSTGGGNATGSLIGSITTAGVVGAEYPAPGALNSTPNGGNLTVGPDSNLWFAETGGNGIGQITTAGTATGFPVPTAKASVQEIVTGPDGALWFTENASGQIGRVTTGGTATEYAIPTAQSGPVGIALGADGALWFTENAAGQIGRIDPVTGNVTEFATPTANSAPTGIAAGPDGALWFTESGANKIGRIPTTAASSSDITEYPLPTASSGPQAITADTANGVLWFTEVTANQIGRVTTDGAVTEYATPTNPSAPTGITIGPDGAVWFTENTASQIGQLTFVAQLAVSCTFPAGPENAQATYAGSCTTTGGIAPYTYAVVSSGGSAPGVTIDPNSGALSGSLNGAGTFTFTVTATDSGTPPQTASIQSAPFTVIPLPITLTCTIPAGVLGTAYSGNCDANFGTPPYAFSIVNGALPLGLSLDPGTGAISGTPAVPGAFAVTVQVADAGSPQLVATAQASADVAVGLTTATGTALFTLNGIPSSKIAAPDQPLSGLTLTLNSPLPVPVTGTFALRFSDFSGNSNTPDGYVDPAVQFLDSNGNPIGTTYQVTVPPGQTTVALPSFDPGTVAGTISVGFTQNGFTEIDPNAVANQLLIPQMAPVIEPSSVQITNVTSTGFDVELVGYSTSREAVSATFTFNPASGSQLEGLNSFTVDISTLTNGWFASASGQKYGSKFLLTMPFTLSGSIGAIQSVTVTLTNLHGSSAAVTGNK